MTSRTRCAICTRPTSGANTCTHCQRQLEQHLGDISALILEAQRIYRSDDRTRGTEHDPLVHSRRRQLVDTPVIVRDPVTGEAFRDEAGKPITVTVKRPEPFGPGEHGRTSPVPWDADHGLGRDLDVTLARQTVLGTLEGPRSAGRPLPYNTSAARTAHEVQLRLAHWVRVVHVDGEAWPPADVTVEARWLLARLDRLVGSPLVVEFDRDVARVIAALRSAVDRPADRWYAGPCDTAGCVEETFDVDDAGRTVRRLQPTQMYADPELQVVKCRRCGTSYDVEARRAWLLDAAQDTLAHAELIGRAAPALGVDITPAAVRGYADRGRIVAHGTDLRGRPLYRVGDVIDVARDVLARRAEVKAKAAVKGRKPRRTA